MIPCRPQAPEVQFHNETQKLKLIQTKATLDQIFIIKLKMYIYQFQKSH